MALGLRGPMAMPPAGGGHDSGAWGTGKGTRRRGRKQHPETGSGKQEFIVFFFNKDLLQPC